MIKRIAKRFLRAGRVLGGSSDDPFLTFAPPGHFYSPLPALHEVKTSPDPCGEHAASEQVADVDLNAGSQLDLLRSLARYYAELPFPETRGAGTRYYFDQPNYCYSDAIYFYGMLRHFQPARLIEVGSGYSSAVALDTADHFLPRKLQCTFIEPYPQRLQSLLRPSDFESVEILTSKVQHLDPSLFSQLSRNDFLFIDSSHVSKFGSDVNYLLFRVLPALAPGVIIHIHDMFYPFEYPKSWLLEGRAWNEAYLVHAFLQNNNAYEVLLMSSFVGLRFQDTLRELMPLCLRNIGGSLWLRKK